jgi:FAD/FMN-containing dehydrogenase
MVGSEGTLGIVTKIVLKLLPHPSCDLLMLVPFNKLEKAGIPSSHVRAYMLIGFDKHETWDRIWYRFNRMVERDIEPYPMVFHKPGKPARTDLKCFQRWTNRGLYRIVSWADYRRQTKSDESVAAWHRAAA